MTEDYLRNIQRIQVAYDSTCRSVIIAEKLYDEARSDYLAAKSMTEASIYWCAYELTRIALDTAYAARTETYTAYKQFPRADREAAMNV